MAKVSRGPATYPRPKLPNYEVPRQAPLKVSLFDLNRFSVCLLVTLGAFLVDNFFPLIAGQCNIKAIWFCRHNSYRVAEKHAIAKYTEEKRKFWERRGVEFNC